MAVLQPLLLDMSSALENSFQALKKASDENVRLREELKKAQSDKVTLEKVASEKAAAAPSRFQFSKEAITESAQALVDCGFMREEHITKFAADLSKDPALALGLLNKVASLSTGMPPTGKPVTKFVTKRANTQSDDDLDDVAKDRELERRIVQQGA